jgi:hypothetical protein
MKLETFNHSSESGWSVKPFPPLDSPQTLVIAFGAPQFIDNPEPLRELRDAYPSSHVVGCSSSGEIFGTQVFDGTIAVAVVRFDKGSIEHSFAEVASPSESYEAGEKLARSLLRDGLRGVLVLSDGIQVNGTSLVRGINAVLATEVVVTGGLAGDAGRFQRTWVIRDGAPISGGISLIGFYGDSILIGHGSKGGWDIFGPQRIVTKAEGNVLYELDREPALALYKKYLGDRASGLPATGLFFPLAIYPNEGEEKTLVRTILATDDEKHSMTFAGDIPVGAKVQFMKANFDRLVQGASDAAKLTTQRNNTAGDTLSIAISCIGRRLVLGERTEEETEATLEILPKGTKQIGFYSYGEISPYASGHCDLHNQTMTLTTISEA